MRLHRMNIFTCIFNMNTRRQACARIHLHHLHCYNYLMTFYQFLSFVLQDFE